jgi:primosomal protein N' (replication factor Y)
MPTYLEIVVNVPSVEGVFHYHLPPELEGQVDPGHLVEVPFGKRRVQGVVMKQIAQPSVAETRAVHALVDQSVVLTSTQLALAEHLSESTLAPLSACINLMLPVGLAQMADSRYTDNGPGTAVGGPALTDLQRRVLDLLDERGPLLGRQIDRALPRVRWRLAIRPLIRRGRITTQPVLPAPNVQPKSVRTARLACSPEVAVSKMEDLGRTGSKARERRQSVMRYLLDEPGPVEVSWVYAASGGNLQDLRYLAERDLVVLGESQVWRDPLEGMEFVSKEPPQLTGDQEKIWQEIVSALQQNLSGQILPPYVLHGVTGSGKTEIYLRAVNEIIHRGQQAIILVPEIALTPQTVRRFLARFPGQVGLVHSKLSTGERYDTWRRARQGDLGVIVGPRSALFTPLPNLGLIVVDECHDDTYYQGEIPPYYHARRAAVAYAQLTGALCLLGSATPDLESFYQADQGEWRYLHLPARILAHRQAVEEQMERFSIAAGTSHYEPLEHQAETIDLPPVKVVDMREELKAGNRSIFSRALRESLHQVLARDQQAILFLNRRGTATYIFCRDCGRSLLCPRCDNPLTYHHPRRSPTNLTPTSGIDDLTQDQQPRPDPALTCHHCGYRRKMPRICPHCSSTHIRHYGTGTERVEADLQTLFPQVRTLRWDYETTRKKGAHEIIMSHFLAHRADVLIGTQMLAKGLDLPLVTLVGVILADVGLNLPDFHAAERTFQVLTQVAGRAGRSPLGGEVYLQTYQPDHYVIQAAAGHDFLAFYQRELAYRRQIGYPPFSQLVRLEVRNANATQAEKSAQDLAGQIHHWLRSEGKKATQVIGPVPPFFARLKGNYRWQIILRGPDPVSILRGRQLRDWRVEVNPPNLL